MKLTILNTPRKHLIGLSADKRHRILDAIMLLPKGDVKPLKGEKGVFRLRVGDLRVVFEFIGSEIVVRRIGSRGDVYKK